MTWVRVRAQVTFTVDTDRAREEGMTGRAREIALEVINGSSGAEFDNMVLIDDIEDARVVNS